MTDSPTSDSQNRAAMLVVHGLGQQNPYQMLDLFARGLIDHYQANIARIEPRIFYTADQAALRSCITLHFKQPLGRQGLTSLDLYEFYWAGMVQGQVSLGQMLRWSFRTSVPPLKLWSQQMALPETDAQSFLRLLPTLLRELGTAFGLLLVVCLIIFPFIYIPVHLDGMIAAGGQALALLRQVNDTTPGLFGSIIVLILILLEILVTASIGQILYRLLAARRGIRRSMEAVMLQRWLAGSIALWLFLAGLVGLILYLAEPTILALTGQLGQILLAPPVGWSLLAIGLAYGAAQLLINYVGDIPLYIGADEKSEFYRTRHDIKQVGVDLITSLLDEANGYSAVYVAGHSLGSVIAYDCLNQIVRRARAGRDLALYRLKGLLTFGSPLDKTYYFFRDTVGDQEAVRAQIQSFLHGFRRRSSGRDYTPYRFAQYQVMGVAQMQWVNIYSMMDIVSDRLEFYRVDVQVAMPYRIPLTAHSAYWVDPRFYCTVATLLEGRTSYDACTR